MSLRNCKRRKKGNFKLKSSLNKIKLWRVATLSYFK